MMQIPRKGKNKMDKKKKKALVSKGYKVGSVDEFLRLSKEESEYIELKLALSQALTERRKQSKRQPKNDPLRQPNFDPLVI